ncbi:MAG: preprotein translocase subunit SecE [Clostridia bacterium]|nr:preprotein translocase subunit SecE [Clostridia bacterium]
MADEKTTIAKEGEKKENKFLSFLKNLPKRIATPFKNMWHELKKVTWPTKKDLIQYTCIVLLFMAFMGIVIGLLDMGASKLVTAVSSAKAPAATEIPAPVATEAPVEATEGTAEGTDGVEAPADNAVVESTEAPSAN